MLELARQVSVVTVTRDSLARLRLRTAQLVTLPNWIAVDNASTDGTVDWLREKVPNCRVMVNSLNEGFGRANNRALAEVRTPYALLLNPDCVVDIASIEALVECALRNPNAALIGPRYRETDGRQQESYRPFIHRRKRIKGPYHEPAGDLCTEFITGAAVLINIELLRPFGFFDPWYFLYCEDEDLCWTARRNGLAVMVAAGALAYHSASRSTAPTLSTIFLRHYCHTLSKLYLRRKLGGSKAAVALYGLSILGGSLLGLPFRLLLGSPRRLAQNIARIAAVLSAPAQLSRRECRAGPGMLFSSLLSGSKAGDSKA